MSKKVELWTAAKRRSPEYIKKIREAVDLPPLPKVVYEGPPPVKWLVKECQRCGRQFETTIKSAVVVQCGDCWRGKKPKASSAGKPIKLQGLKTKIPR